MEQQEIQNFVKVEHDFQQGRRTLKTVKTFRRGAVLAKEAALVATEADRDDDVKRLAAYLGLNEGDKRELLQKVITDLELSQFGMSADGILSEDKSEMKRLLIEAEAPDAEPKQAAEGMARWRMSAPVCKTRIYRTLSKTSHSCAAQVELEHGASGMGSLIARYEIGPAVWIGAWLLEDCTLWWKGADSRARELQLHDMLPADASECRCGRCQDGDVCRAIRCPKCSKGELVRNGKAKLWRCGLHACEFEGADGDELIAPLLKVERQLRQDLIHLEEVSTEELYRHAQAISAELGSGHWLLAAVWRELYKRHLGPEQEQCFRSVAAGLSFMGWLASRRLPTPPPGLVDELVTMLFGVLEFLKVRATGEGVRDLRVVFLRASTLASELLDGFGNPRLFERLKPILAMAVNMRRRCGFCKNRLTEQVPQEYPETFGDEDGGEVEERGPAGCHVCGELAYCDMGCQMADGPRHRAFCVPCSEGLWSNRVRHILVPTA